MKTKSSPFITALVAAALISPVFALEAPEDDAPPPPQGNGNALPLIKLPATPPAAPKTETAFLGVVSGEVPEVLADHIDLKHGEGVVVRSLVPDGPAAHAGISINDVIVKVGGQPVGSPQEISKQISDHKPGQALEVDLIHKGKSSTLSVTLGLKPAELANASAQPLDQLDLDGFPKELADRIRGAIAGNVGGLDPADDPAQLHQRMDQAIRKLQKHMQGAMGQAGFAPPPNPGAAAQTESHGEATVKMRDNDGSVEVKSKDGAKEVTIRDHQDNVTWSGPWDTAQDKAGAPADVRQRVESLNLDTDFKGNGLRLKMHQAAPPADEGQH
jgi:serine protease Do